MTISQVRTVQSPKSKVQSQNTFNVQSLMVNVRYRSASIEFDVTGFAADLGLWTLDCFRLTVPCPAIPSPALPRPDAPEGNQDLG